MSTAARIHSRELLQQIVDVIPSPVFVKDREHRWVIVNKAFCDLMGRSAEELHGRSDDDFFPKEQVRVFWEVDDRVFASGEPIENEELHTDAHGTTRTIITCKRLVGLADGTRLLVGVITDVTRYREAEAHIRHLAHHDALTGLANRALFRERLGRALAAARRRGGPVAVLCLDLDRFKPVNDTLGHPVGDALLRAVAARLLACVREGDTAARLGGDEFAVLQAGAGQPEAAGALARRLVEALSAPYEVLGHQVVVGASVGVALAPGDGRDPDELLKRADMALYRAKADGRGTFRSFEPGMDARLQARRLLELDLRKALAAGELELHYQPLVDLRTGAVSALEALLRWRHPARGLVPPGEFVPLAEEIGLIVPVGGWVLRRACADAAGWPGGVRVAVNLSAAQFRGRELVAAVVGALAAAGLAPARLELEITETVLLRDGEATLATLRELRALGVRIAMDDFGTGYSSLGYLRSFPFDKIKIDRCFVRDLGASADCEAIVRAVTGLGGSLGIATTAEGVETEEQLERLRAEGCDEAQGFHLGRPMPAADIRALLDRGDGRRRPDGPPSGQDHCM
jgi:diguanylate cyclase (GGDEF)-like protein/PAS domain S-box-containing protein